jgi:hypothetical protein
VEDFLKWALENPRAVQIMFAVIAYIVGCIIKSKIVADAALQKVTDALEAEEARPGREAVSRTSVGSILDTVIADHAAKSDPKEEKKPESKLVKGLRWLNIVAGAAALLKK